MNDPGGSKLALITLRFIDVVSSPSIAEIATGLPVNLTQLPVVVTEKSVRFDYRFMLSHGLLARRSGEAGITTMS